MGPSPTDDEPLLDRMLRENENRADILNRMRMFLVDLDYMPEVFTACECHDLFTLIQHRVDQKRSRL